MRSGSCSHQLIVSDNVLSETDQLSEEKFMFKRRLELGAAKVMMTSAFLLAGFLNLSDAKADPAYSCQAQCIGLDQSRQQLQVLGPVMSLKWRKSEAWSGLDRKCQALAHRLVIQGYNVSSFLAADFQMEYSSSIHSGGNSTSHSHWNDYGYGNVWWGYSQSWNGAHSSSHYSWYQEDQNQRMSVRSANPNDSSTCERVDAAEYEVEVYEGPLPVLG